MRFQQRFALRLLSMGLVILGVFAGFALDSRADQPELVKIGMVKSLFRDVPNTMVQLLMVPFSTLMRAQTGLNGTLVTVDNALDLGDQLEKKKLQLGVFHGFEFAWAQEKYPNLKPLMIAVNRSKEISAALVTRQDSKVEDFQDLKGCCLALPLQTKGHCHLFLERNCDEQGGCGPDGFFSKILNHRNVELGLDDVVRGKVQAIVVDNISLECYQQVKPGCFARLKVLKQSQPFPSAVIAYREGALDAETVKKFHDGMINANKNNRSRELMMMWKLTGFEPVPENYQELLSSIRRTYPSPESRTRAGVANTQKRNAD